ncbi:MAG TPA: BON domain-containing protein [Terracidiphilus sp.]|nr:BON domain-containing protein [Terracidiphilus sp.]
MRIWTRICFGLLGVALFTPVFVAAQQKPSSSDQVQKSSPGDQVFVPGSPDENQLAKEVRHNLLMLPYYSIFDDLSFTVNGSVVTLQGACPPEAPWDIKSDAEAAVKRVKGVTQVINNIKLLPLSPNDWQIRRAEEHAIYGDPDLGTRYGYQALPSIHIIVDNGHVTLTGVVDSNFDKTLINTRANTVPGVFSVDNDLIVANQGKKENVSSTK